MHVINEHNIKISMSKINIPNELKIDDEVTIVLTGDVTKTEDSSNQDGTVDRTYVVKGMYAKVEKNG